MIPRHADEVAAFNDIATAIERLRRAFKRHHLSPPVAIELGTHEDMNRLRASLPREYFLSHVEMQDRPNVVANILGVEIVAPAEFRARKRGGFDIT